MPQNDPKDKKITVSLKTLSQMLDASRSSVRRWLKENGIKPIAIGRGPKGAIRYHWKEVKEWIESRQYVD
jgi:predicted DNA-binding transcriptional regulator AlpA